MHKPFISFGSVLIALLTLTGLTGPVKAAEPASRPSDDLVYQPPPHSHGNVRVEGGSGTRGEADDLPSLYILAPDHVGLTVEEQPFVFWYLSKATNAPLVLTLMPDDPSVKVPILDIKLDAAKPGIQSLDLSKCNVKLEAGVDYQISLALKPVNNQGSKDVFCSAEITRVLPPTSLVSQMLATADPLEKYKLLLKNGMFYDALMMVSRQIDSELNSTIWRERRASLLEQVGLAEPAAFDRTTLNEIHSSLAR